MNALETSYLFGGKYGPAHFWTLRHLVVLLSSDFFIADDFSGVGSAPIWVQIPPGPLLLRIRNIEIRARLGLSGPTQSQELEALIKLLARDFTGRLAKNVREHRQDSRATFGRT